MLKSSLIYLIILICPGFGDLVKDDKGKQNNIYWFYFIGSQTPSDRENSENYCPMNLISICLGGINECVVVTNSFRRDTNGIIRPNFSNVTFDFTTGMPNGGTGFIANFTSL
jgi:hypothetical protein